jgi:hypothetical protein
MNKNIGYDDLESNEKRKWTKEYNRLDDVRIASYRIPLDAYRAKSEKLRESTKVEIDTLYSECNEQIQELEQLIAQKKKERDGLISVIREAQNKEVLPEYQAFSNAQRIAHEWFTNEWKKRKEEMLKEWGYVVEEKKEEVNA